MTVNGGAAHAGEQIKLRITSDPAPISNDDIQIAGVKESALKMADANGVVTFSVTLNAAGTYTVQAFNAAGALVGDQVLTVSAVGAAAGAELSDTCFDGMGLAVGAGALVLPHVVTPAAVTPALRPAS